MSPLDDNHRARIEASLPPGVKMTPEAWADLAEIVRGYLALSAGRADYPIEEERARWARIGDAVERLAVELRRLRRESPWDGPDPGWINRALTALWEVRGKVETHNAWHGTWSAFGGRRQPHRELLFCDAGLDRSPWR
jgi:hypothetical protein